ncbi:hypothetical protein, partial [Priestia megaterium]|uniref:hypothetical protein n=1 Tax=Priestia megaterium TaxID=1404 RepID=UPI0035B68220
DTANFVWDGGGDGTSWHDPVNWVGDVLPDATADVLIPDQVGDVTIAVSQSITVNSIYAEENVAVSQSSLNITGGALLSGLSIAGGVAN